MKTSPGGPGVRIVHTRCAVCTHTGYLWLWGAYLAHIHDLPCPVCVIYAQPNPLLCSLSCNDPFFVLCSQMSLPQRMVS